MPIQQLPLLPPSDGTSRWRRLVEAINQALQSLSAGAVKAWCSFDGTVGAPVPAIGSFNVASITKNATGDYTINFIMPMLNIGYAVSVSNNLNATDPVWMSLISTNTTSTRFTLRRGGAFAGALVDTNGLTVMVTALGGYQ